MAVTKFQKAGKTLYKVQVSKVDENGKRHQRKRYVNSISDAYVTERDLIKELEEVISGKKQITWEELFKEYYAWACKAKAPTTVDREKYSLSAYANPVFNSRLVKSIKPSDIDDLLLGILKEKSKATQKTVLRYISSVMNFAVDRGYIENNPCRNKSKLIRLEEKVKPILDREQVQYLLQRAKECEVEWYEHWFMAVYCGMRNGELYYLRFKHIDLKKNLITVEGSWNSKAGFHSTKNREVRYVPINPILREFLIELREKKQPASEEEFVLKRIPSWDKGNQARELRLFCKAIGLPPINFHALRAVHITQLLLNNTPLPVTMRLVGHKQLSTVLRYMRLTGREIAHSTDCLDFSCNGAAAGRMNG